MAGMFKISK